MKNFKYPVVIPYAFISINDTRQGQPLLFTTRPNGKERVGMNKVRKADQDNRRVHSLQDVDSILRVCDNLTKLV